MISDKAVLAALKRAEKASESSANREKARIAIQEVTAELKEPSIKDSLSRISDYFFSRKRMREIGKKSSAPLMDFIALGTGGFLKSMEFCWANISKDDFSLPLDELVAVAPSPKIIDIAVKKEPDLRARMLAGLLDKPRLAAKSAALDWFVTKGKTPELVKLVPLLVSLRERVPYLLSAEQLFTKALSKDKSGKLLRACLILATSDSASFAQLRSLVRMEPKLFPMLVAALPKTISDLDGKMAVDLFESLVSEFPKVPAKLREELSGSIAVLVGRVLKRKRRKPLEQRIVEIVGSNLSGWLAAMEKLSSPSGFWLIASADAFLQARNANGQVSPYAAGLVASSIAKAKEGFGADALLEALAINFGMEPFGEVGGRITFDARLHDDTAGGLLPGHDATVRERGWKLKEQVVQKAKVVPSHDA